MIVLILLLAIFATKPYLNSQFPYTHDGENHLARFANYKLAIIEGQFPPRFAPNLLNHYGYPVFNYNYPLANIISLPFSFLKLNYEITFKLLVFGFVCLGLYGVYKWLRLLRFRKQSIIFSLFIFALSPYLISAITYRGSIGEIMAIGLFPWLLFSVELVLKNKIKFLTFLKLILVFTAFLLSHNIAVLFGLVLLLIYSFLRFGRNINLYKKLGLVLLFSLGLSFWFWLPAIAEKNLIILDNADLSSGYKDHFPTLNQLLFSPLEFGFSRAGSIDSLSFNLGLTQIGVLILGLSYLFLNKTKKALSSSLSNKLLILSLLLVILQLSITLPIWEAIPFVYYIQFPWRLTLFFNIFILPVAAFIFSNSNRITKLIFVSLISIQAFSISKIKPADYFHKTNIDYNAFSQTTSTTNENLPKSFEYKKFADWQPTPNILNGDGEIEVNLWHGSNRNYQLKLSQESVIVEPTANFAGWETKIINNNKKLKYIDNKEIKGRIAFKLKSGEYKIETKFTQNTWPRIIGNSTSFVTLALLSSLFLLNAKKRNL